MVAVSFLFYKLTMVFDFFAFMGVKTCIFLQNEFSQHVDCRFCTCLFECTWF
jgi:hypothetical protein